MISRGGVHYIPKLVRCHADDSGRCAVLGLTEVLGEECYRWGKSAIRSRLYSPYILQEVLDLQFENQ